MWRSGSTSPGRSRKAAVPTFFMIDLDDFKQVYDTLGHLERDRVIVEFANLLSCVFDRSA